PSDEDWARVTGSRVAGRRGATPASGRYPLLVYAGIGGLSANTILFEYLASHGYVVASVPLLGTSSAWYNRGEWTTAAIETMTEDLAWAFRYAAALPHVDAQRTAVIGMSAGAQGVLFAMQNENVRAIAGFETMFPETVTDAARFDIRALRVPILHLPSEEIADRPTPVFESLRYADRTEAVIEKSTHAASYQFPRLAAAARAKENGRDEVADAHPQYEIMARLVRRFLDWKLKDDAMAGQEMARSRWTEHGRTISLQRTAALPPVPTEAELLAMVRQGRVADVRRIVTEAREREPGLQLFTKAAMTTTARFLERDRGASVAEGVFRLIEEAYPANAISPLTTRGGFVAVVVPDLDESIRWYSEKFGLRLVKRDQSDRASFAILEGGGLIVELIRGDGGAPGSGPRLGVFKAGIFVENLASTVDALKDRAVPIELGPFPKRPDQRANLIIRDNAGNLIQFIEQ
ncbi:MAG TPA: VOC family protein, partial [Thermoanaerobaculia bacterium]|nr:VOC family protein [Thermoanaerobaculia bacterium]